MQCSKLGCKRKVSYSCNYTPPETYYCEKHSSKHIKSSNKTHPFSSVYSKPTEGVKEAILQILTEEISKLDTIKTEIIVSFNQILADYENSFKKILKEIDSNIAEINSCFEKVCKEQMIPNLDDDPVLKLLALEPNEAAEKVKTIFIKNTEFFYGLSNKISKIVNSPISDLPQVESVNSTLNLEILEMSYSIIVEPEFEIIPCPPAIASKINQKYIKTEIQRKYNLISIRYNGEAFVLNGASLSVRQEAAEELRKIISQEITTNVHWEWLRDDGTFEPYSSNLSEVIEHAYNRSETSLEILIRGVPYKIIFGNPHVQVISNSNISKTVRRIEENKGKNGIFEESTNSNGKTDIIWYWEDDDGAYKEYTIEASRQIETAYRQNSKALIQGKDLRAYLVDPKKMIQKNEKTNSVRRIRRGNP